MQKGTDDDTLGPTTLPRPPSSEPSHEARSEAKAALYEYADEADLTAARGTSAETSIDQVLGSLDVQDSLAQSDADPPSSADEYVEFEGGSP